MMQNIAIRASRLSKDISFNTQELTIKINSSKSVVELQIENYRRVIDRVGVKA